MSILSISDASSLLLSKCWAKLSFLLFPFRISRYLSSENTLSDTDRMYIFR